MKTVNFSIKFYVITFFLLCGVIIGWWMIFTIGNNDVLTEAGEPVSPTAFSVFKVLLCIVISTWTLSLIVLIRQIISGHAFIIDESGIHSTVTVDIVLSLLIIVPIKRIPFEAIKSVEEMDGNLVANLDKSKLEVFPILRFFARKEFCFLGGFTKESKEEIKTILNRYMKIN